MADETKPARTPLRAAMVRFPTLDPEIWPRVARALADLGFNAIDVPLVWREHERAEGVFDLATGPLSLPAMLDAVASAGMRAVLRLGPIVTDDAAGLCLPERVLRDRECQARTRRQNPVYVPDPPRVVPMPSTASSAYRAEAARWVAAAARAASAHAEVIARVVVGDGPHTLLRDDPFEADHHPDARGELAAVDPPHDGPQGPGLEEVTRETERLVSFREELLRAAEDAGLPGALLAAAVAGAASISPTAAAFAPRRALALPSAPPVAGSLAIWRQVRHALALAEKGAHFDLWSGGPVYYPPTRGSHTVAAARVAIAAGARDFTVRMGCAGDRWVGAVLSERGQARPHAHLWRELLAWAAALPDGEDLAADIEEPAGLAASARAATSVHPLPLGLVALVGITAGQIASSGAPVAHGRTAREWEAQASGEERALTDAGVPARRVPHGRAGELVSQRGEAPEAFAARAASALAAVVPRIEPAGAALVRAVRAAGSTAVVVLSRSAQTATVAPPAGDGWSVDGAVVTNPVSLEPGASMLFSREGTPVVAMKAPAPGATRAHARATGATRPSRKPAPRGRKSK